jgi:hypothetical protein
VAFDALVVKIKQMNPAGMAETRQLGPIREGSFRQIPSTRNRAEGPFRCAGTGYNLMIVELAVGGWDRWGLSDLGTSDALRAGDWTTPDR